MPYTHRALDTIAAVLATCAAITPLAAQSSAVQPRPASVPVTARPSAVGASAAAIAAPAELTAAPFKRGDRVFSTDAAGSLFVRDGRDGKPRLLLAAGTYGVVAPSSDGNYVAYSLPAASPAAGYDVRIRAVQTGRDMPELLHNASVSRKAWTHNEKGFFYTREDATEHRQRVYYHSIGKDQGHDAIVLSQFDEPTWRYEAEVSDDGQYAVFTISHPIDAHTRLYFIDLDDAGKPKINAPVVHLVDSFSARYEFVDDAGSYFFLQTDRGAPRGSVVLANIDVTRAASWPTVIPESADSLLYARTAGDQFVLPVYRIAGVNVARVYGPPDPAAMRAEFQKRLDSLRKERADAERNGRRDRGANDEALRMRAPSPIRLERASDIPIPTGATLLAMNAVADDEEVFYTLRFADGSTRSYMYDVKNRRSQPFPLVVQAR